MRYVHLFMASVFVVFAAVQYNDPDALLWVALYAYAAWLAVLAYRGRPSWTALPAALVYALGALRLAPTIDANWYHTETAREGLGLMLAAAWMLVVVVDRYRAGTTAGGRSGQEG